MPAATPQEATTRRRTSVHTGYGVDVATHADQVRDLIRVPIEPSPWAARKVGNSRVFRGRLTPGTALLPARPSTSHRRGVTVGLATTPIVLRSVGVAHPIPAYTPWVVLASSEWKVTVTDPTDLRLVYTADLSVETVDSRVGANRPVRFDGHESTIVRSAIASVTPVWIDRVAHQVTDLSVVPDAGWRPVRVRSANDSHDRDTVNAFALMMNWAISQRNADEDPRLVAVAQYVKGRLADPNLSTNTIADQLMISRRTLQSLFESEGGIAVFIRRQRLTKVLELITRDPDLIPDLDSIAEQTGLGTRRTLERAMRQVYGLTPRQARTQILAGKALREREIDTLQAS